MACGTTFGTYHHPFPNSLAKLIRLSAEADADDLLNLTGLRRGRGIESRLRHFLFWQNHLIVGIFCLDLNPHYNGCRAVKAEPNA